MASWLTPKHLEDAARVLRGIALVLTKAAVDGAQHRATIGQAQAAVKAAADLVTAQAQYAQRAAAMAAISAEQLDGGAAQSNPLVGYLYPDTMQMLCKQVQVTVAQDLDAMVVNRSGSSAISRAPVAAPVPNPLVTYVFPVTSHLMQALDVPHSFAFSSRRQRSSSWVQEDAVSSVLIQQQQQQQQQQHTNQPLHNLEGHGVNLGTVQQAPPQQPDAAAAAAPAAMAAASHAPSASPAADEPQATTAADAAAVLSASSPSTTVSLPEQQEQHSLPIAGGVDIATRQMSDQPDLPTTTSSAESSRQLHAQQQHDQVLQQKQQQHKSLESLQQLPDSSSNAGVVERVDEWMSGHESVTTQAEASQDASPVTAVAGDTTAAGQHQQQLLQAPPQSQHQPPKRVLRERRVPSTQIGRALGFAGMGASLILGSLTDSITKTLTGSSSNSDAASSSDSSDSTGNGKGNVYSSFITEANAERLAAALCRMRGAALKIGQMLSIQDETVLPPQIQSALERVRAGADVMPRAQLEGQLRSELGRDWASKLAHFDYEPRAAASIGQVHAAVLHDGRQVAMKIQYPGVARSIESDVDNLMRLISIANILPKGLYVENAVKVAKRELALECNYTYEAAAQNRFRQLVAHDEELSEMFYVPEVIPELSSRQVLTTEWVNGVTIDKVAQLDQATRDTVATRLLRLTLRELYDWRFMQTDPNWGNFLYDQQAGRLNLIDFGAAKEYPRRFVDNYLQMVHGCAERNRQQVLDMSVALGFLTGDESAVMLDAHTEAGFVVGLPFATAGLYDFGAHSGMTPRVAELGSVMLKHRLTPPPEESYSLHRKLSGAFLACMKLRARVPCREIFMDTYNSNQFREDSIRSNSEAHTEDEHAAHSATA